VRWARETVRLVFLALHLHSALLSFSRNVLCLLGVCTAMA